MLKEFYKKRDEIITLVSRIFDDSDKSVTKYVTNSLKSTKNGNPLIYDVARIIDSGTIIHFNPKIMSIKDYACAISQTLDEPLYKIIYIFKQLKLQQKFQSSVEIQQSLNFDETKLLDKNRKILKDLLNSDALSKTEKKALRIYSTLVE
jgi:hypothetical protein